MNIEFGITCLWVIAIFSWISKLLMKDDIEVLKKRITKLEKQLNDRTTDLPSRK